MNLHSAWLQVQGQTAEHIISPLEVAEEAHSYEDAAHHYHPHVQHAQRLLELLRVAHFILEGQNLMTKCFFLINAV